MPRGKKATPINGSVSLSIDYTAASQLEQNKFIAAVNRVARELTDIVTVNHAQLYAHTSMSSVLVDNNSESINGTNDFASDSFDVQDEAPVAPVRRRGGRKAGAKKKRAARKPAAAKKAPAKKRAAAKKAAPKKSAAAKRAARNAARAAKAATSEVTE